VPRQKAAESRKIPESGSVIPREGVESYPFGQLLDYELLLLVIPREGVERRVSLPNKDFAFAHCLVIPREGVERPSKSAGSPRRDLASDPERGS